MLIQAISDFAVRLTNTLTSLMDEGVRYHTASYWSVRPDEMWGQHCVLFLILLSMQTAECFYFSML